MVSFSLPEVSLPAPSSIASFPFLLMVAKAGSHQGAEGSQRPLVVGTGVRLTKSDQRKGPVRGKNSAFRVLHLVLSLTSEQKINPQGLFFVIIEKFRFLKMT